MKFKILTPVKKRRTPEISQANNIFRSIIIDLAACFEHFEPVEIRIK